VLDQLAEVVEAAVQATVQVELEPVDKVMLAVVEINKQAVILAVAEVEAQVEVAADLDPTIMVQMWVDQE